MDIELLPLPSAAPEHSREVRVLTADEVSAIAPIFEANGASLPPPNTSFVVGAIEDGRVVGFLAMQLAVHAEPMWIEPGHEAVFGSLTSAAERTLVERVGCCTVFLFAPAGRVARLAQLVGMQVEPWVVMSKTVGLDAAVGEMGPEPVEPVNSESEDRVGEEAGEETVQ